MAERKQKRPRYCRTCKEVIKDVTAEEIKKHEEGHKLEAKTWNG
jgi:hypothetical protein